MGYILIEGGGSSHKMKSLNSGNVFLSDQVSSSAVIDFIRGGNNVEEKCRSDLLLPGFLTRLPLEIKEKENPFVLSCSERLSLSIPTPSHSSGMTYLLQLLSFCLASILHFHLHCDLALPTLQDHHGDENQQDA